MSLPVLHLSVGWQDAIASVSAAATRIIAQRAIHALRERMQAARDQKALPSARGQSTPRQR